MKWETDKAARQPFGCILENDGIEWMKICAAQTRSDFSFSGTVCGEGGLVPLCRPNKTHLVLAVRDTHNNYTLVTVRPRGNDRRREALDGLILRSLPGPDKGHLSAAIIVAKCSHERQYGLLVVTDTGSGGDKVERAPVRQRMRSITACSTCVCI